jgi:hypothetical protein
MVTSKRHGGDMKKMRILVLSLAMMAMCYTARPQAVAPLFSISLNSPQEVWKLGSDIRVDVAIRNNAYRQLFFATCPGEGLEGVCGMGAAVRPGETMRYGILNNSFAEIKRPGRYTVQVQRHEGKTRYSLKSNEIILTVSN